MKTFRKNSNKALQKVIYFRYTFLWSIYYTRFDVIIIKLSFTVWRQRPILVRFWSNNTDPTFCNDLHSTENKSTRSKNFFAGTLKMSLFLDF